jgi:MarR family transcriptional regulator, lower aerobic nicotinate degradation pathway regulator
VRQFCKSLSRNPGFLVRRLPQIYVAPFLEECAAFEITPMQFSLLKALSDDAGLDQSSIGSVIGADRKPSKAG